MTCRRERVYLKMLTPIFEGSENLTGAGQPERVEGVNTSFSYFSMLGVIPQIGRLYGPQDFTPGFAPEAVISDGLWRRVPMAPRSECSRPYYPDRR